MIRARSFIDDRPEKWPVTFSHLQGLKSGHRSRLRYPVGAAFAAPFFFRVVWTPKWMRTHRLFAPLRLGYACASSARAAVLPARAFRLNATCWYLVG